MKRKYKVKTATKTIEREYNYIPVRYIVAVLITLFEILAIIGIVVACCYYIPYFYIAAYLTEIFCVIKIIASDDNPDYKVPWLLFVLIIPIAGFMLYFLFYSRKLPKRYVKRLRELSCYQYLKDDKEAFELLNVQNPIAASQAKMLTKISYSHLFTNTRVSYFSLGEEMFSSILCDLEKSERFILMEYFIIEEGTFFDTILHILKKKAASGVTVRLVYDDIGCMTTLPGNY